MKGSTSYKVDPSKELETRNELDKAVFKFVDADYAFWRASNGEATITFYDTGKLLIQGRDLDNTIQLLMGIGVITSEAHHNYQRWVGSDESGKGDYFGPLTVAGVLITRETHKELLRIGVRDSKCLSDYAINKLAPKIKDLCPHSVIAINPARYNQALRDIAKLWKA